MERPAIAAGLRPPRLVLLQSPYRRFLKPLLDFLESVEREHPRRDIAVIIPELVKSHWWQHLLHYHLERPRKEIGEPG